MFLAGIQVQKQARFYVFVLIFPSQQTSEMQKWNTERRLFTFVKITDLTDLLSWPKKRAILAVGAAEEMWCNGST